jgi:phage major head subunit gpT-like protein
VITPANYAKFVTDINTMWGTIYESLGVEEYYQRIATTVPVDSTQWEMAWTGVMPKARVWAGPRHTYEPAPQTYIAVPQPFELTYTIDKFNLDDDQFGVLFRMLPDLARQLKRWPDLQMRDLLEASGAFSSTTVQQGFDGLSNWNTAHLINFYNASLGSYCNDFTGGGVNQSYTKSGGGTVTTLVGGALAPVAYSTLAEYMQTLKGEDGEVLGVVPNLMQIGPPLEVEANMILKAAYFAPPQWGVNITGQVGAAENVLKRFGVDYMVNKFLKNAYTWYLMDTTNSVKPFTWVLRAAPQVTPRISPDDPVVFDTHKLLWGAWMRGCPAWSYSFLAARSGP